MVIDLGARASRADQLWIYFLLPPYNNAGLPNQQSNSTLAAALLS